jgi:hypothetical protein
MGKDNGNAIRFVQGIPFNIYTITALLPFLWKR